MSAVDASRPWRGGPGGNHFGERGIIVVFAVLLAVLAAVAVLIALIDKPPAPKSVCPKHQVCANPPVSRKFPPLYSSSSPRLINDQVFTSALGYQFEYPSVLSASSVTSTDVTIAPPGSDGIFLLNVQGAPSGDATPQQMLDRSLTSLHDKIPDLQSADLPAFEVLAPALGGRAGVGGFYQGTYDSPSGWAAPADVAILAATDGQETVAVAVTIANRSRTDGLLRLADEAILGTFRFGRDVVR